MKKLLGYSFIFIINYLLISLIVFSFSYISLINNQTYDLLWVKYIQKKLYFNGMRKLWNVNQNCSTYDKDLLYAPVIGECIFSNPEFTTKLNFDENRRLNLVDDHIDEEEKVIATLGDSLTMGWGVNNDETYSFNLQKLINKKVINLGVASYGTIREIKRLKLNKYYDQIDTILIQYHLNDIYENKTLDINKTYLKSDYEKYFLDKNSQQDFSVFLLKNYKKSLRLLFSHLKDIIYNNKETHNLTEHLKYLEDIISNYLKEDNKKVIVFLIKEPYQKFIFDYEIKNFKFSIINTKKDHFFIIDDHLNKLGHKFISQKLFDYLSK